MSCKHWKDFNESYAGLTEYCKVGNKNVGCCNMRELCEYPDKYEPVACYICGKPASKQRRVMESPEDEWGVLVDVCEGCYGEGE